MKVIKPGYSIISPIDREAFLKRLEFITRTCYKSEDKITELSAPKMIRALIRNKHLAMLEHCSFSVKFIVDRGISHEIVRHRLASFAQESTRYCNYSQDKFENEITVIEPFFFTGEAKHSAYISWYAACKKAEKSYFELLDWGATPQEARSVLPTSVKTEICVTMNLREWRHFFELRACDYTGAAHPQIKEVAIPLLKELHELLPEVFDDLIPVEYKEVR